MVFSWIKDKIPHCSYVKKRMNGNIMIICASSLTIYYLNQSAAFFINSADGTKTVSDIKDEFLQHYEVDACELERDIVDIIRDLQWKRILTLEE